MEEGISSGYCMRCPRGSSCYQDCGTMIRAKRNKVWSILFASWMSGRPIRTKIISFAGVDPEQMGSL